MSDCKKQLYGPFLRIESNCLNVAEPLRGCCLLLTNNFKRVSDNYIAKISSLTQPDQRVRSSGNFYQHTFTQFPPLTSFFWTYSNIVTIDPLRRSFCVNWLLEKTLSRSSNEIFDSWRKKQSGKSLDQHEFGPKNF